MNTHLISAWNQAVEWSTVELFVIGDTSVSIGRLIGLIFILAFFWWLSAVIEKTLRRVAERSGIIDESAVYALTRIARYIIWIVGSILGLIYIGFNLASLALVGGAIGVGIGFGLQNIFSNLISGVIILLEKTLKIGDFVDLQSGVVGRVTEISMRYTRVTTNDSVDIIVPNSEFINGRVINWTFGEQSRRIHIPFGVAYGSNKELVREAGIAAANAVPGTIVDEKRQPEVWLVGFGNSSLDFELVVWVSLEAVISPGKTNARFLWAIEDELAKRGLEIPFPQRDLHIRSGTLHVALDENRPSPVTTAQ